MFNFFTKKTQPQRVLELLQKKRTVSSLELSQMHPVILNFHECIHDLRTRHEIETVIEKVHWIKHTKYIYHGKLTCPMPHEHKRSKREEKAYEEWFQACMVMYNLK